MKRYQVVLKWGGPRPRPNTNGLATYIIDVADESTAADAVRSALVLAPRVDPAVPSPLWAPIEVWQAVPLTDLITDE